MIIPTLEIILTPFKGARLSGMPLVATGQEKISAEAITALLEDVAKGQGALICRSRVFMIGL